MLVSPMINTVHTNSVGKAHPSQPQGQRCRSALPVLCLGLPWPSRHLWLAVRGLSVALSTRCRFAHAPCSSPLEMSLHFPGAVGRSRNTDPKGLLLGAILCGYKHRAEHLCAGIDVWFLDHSPRRGSQTPVSTIKAPVPKLLSKKTQTLLKPS